MERMARGQKPDHDPAKKPDSHKPSRMFRIPLPLVELLEKLADKDLSTTTEQLKSAIREYLQRRGMLDKATRARR